MIACGTLFLDTLNSIDRHTWFAHYYHYYYAHSWLPFSIRRRQEKLIFAFLWPVPRTGIFRFRSKYFDCRRRCLTLHRCANWCERFFFGHTPYPRSKSVCGIRRPVRRWWRTYTASLIHVRLYLTQFVRCNKTIKKNIVLHEPWRLSTGPRTAALHSWPIQ